MNATFKTRREGSLAPPSRMNLGLYDNLGATQFRCDLPGLFRRKGDTTWLRGNSKLGEKFPGLVFVDVHSDKREVDGN